MKLLIVDDEKLVCEKMRTILPWPDFGFTTILCTPDSLKAFDLIDQHTPELIITDIAMPVKNGLEIVEYVRRRKLKTHIILISAYDAFDYAHRAINLGVQAYLLKPISVDLLREKVTQILALSPDAPPVPAPVVDKKEQLRLAIDEYLQRNLNEKITLAEMARAFYFTPPYFSHLFTQLYGLSFTDYLTKLKIDRSLKYLADSRYKVTQIAEMLGFADYRYFIRIFEKYNGCSPLQYRKNHAQTIE